MPLFFDAFTAQEFRRASVKNAEFDGVRNFAQIVQNSFAISGSDVGDGIADRFRGFQILAEDIGLVRGKNMVELCEHAGNIFVNVDQAVGFLDFMQLDSGKIHAIESRALLSVVDDPF